jgi:hypothetical protein
MTTRVAALTLIALAAGASGALAQTRLSTTSMTCAGAASFVASHGAVVIGTGGDTYERVVTGQGFCNRGEDTKPLFAPTRDRDACFIGYYCFEYSRNSK